MIVSKRIRHLLRLSASGIDRPLIPSLIKEGMGVVERPSPKILYNFSIIILLFNTGLLIAQQDFFYVPKNIKKPAPALIITSCTGATKKDLDSNQAIADKLGWIICTSAKTKNHRDTWQNDRDIMETYRNLTINYPVDTSRVFIYGFSGQAVQAMMEVFLHPGIFKGAVCICAHDGALGLAKWELIKEHYFYLITRENNWNLEANKRLHRAFNLQGIADTMIVTKGRHGPKTSQELLEGCRWLYKMVR